MGFFDRLAGKKPESNDPAAAEPAPAAAGGVMPRLVAARERLEAKDLPAALAIYDEVLAAAGDRADVLVTISADLGLNGHLREIIELVAPRYDAELHGPATGLNVLQAYLAMREPEAAQHVLDILFALNRPELEERLHGFSNAVAELINAQATAVGGDDPPSNGTGEVPEETKVNLVSISKPIWFYGLESLSEQILPAKPGRLRRVAFAQLALPGLPNVPETMKQPEDELGRLTRALPLWLAETFAFSPHYAPVAAVGVMNGKHYAIFGAEWSVENLRQLVDSTEGGLDYIFTGALRHASGDFELLLRVWEVKKFRERRTFTARWTPVTADAELTRLHEQIRMFMEWSPAAADFTYAPPVQSRAWLDTLSASLTFFLADKGLLAKEQVAATDEVLALAAANAAGSEAAALAFLTLGDRATRLGFTVPKSASLAASPLVEQAKQALAQ